MLDTPAPEDLDELRAEHPDRVAAWPAANTFFVGLDVQQPPFNDERVRQALAYAIDREHVVELLGGPVSHRLTCQVLPPTFQGYSPFCPFTVEADSPIWTAPDRARAESLIRDTDVAGARVSVLVARDGLIDGAVEVMEYVTGLMRELGVRPHLEVLPSGLPYFREHLFAPAGAPPHPQVFFSGWLSDYPAASDFIIAQFHCPPEGSANFGGWCDEALDARMDDALQLSLTDPGEGNRAWTRIEHELVERAAQVPVTNLIYNYAVSDRVGNVQVHPHWGLLPSRLWIE